MAGNRTRRLQKEIQDIVKDKQSGITITTPQGSAEITDFTRFKGHFDGPPDTPYEGGHYQVDIKITAEYPFKPPEMRFITKIWHPNVSSQTGAICLDTLSHAWSPVLTLKSALISLQSLLSSPEPKDPQDAEVASMLITKPEEFARVAREWAVRYADAPDSLLSSAKNKASGSDEFGSRAKKSQKPDSEDKERRDAEKTARAYRGYPPRIVDNFVQLGFQVRQVVEALDSLEVYRNNGQDYELEEEDIADITAKLFGEE